MKLLIGFIAGLVVGVVAGAVGAVVFAGETDHDLREVYRTARKNVESVDVQELTLQAQENIAEMGAKLKEQAMEIQDQAQDQIAEVVAKAQKATENGKALEGTAAAND